jgi:hypothetical protein
MPWGGDDVREAEATPADYGICNVSVSDLPEGVEATTLPYPAPRGDGNTPAGKSIYLFLRVPLAPDQPWSEEDPATGTVRDVRSRVVIDAVTGDVVFENYRTPAEQTMLKEALETLSVGPWRPVVDAWPRTDTSPTTGEVIEIRKPVEVLTDYDKVILTYRRPDPRSGLIAGTTRGDSFDRISAYTCDSIVEIDGRTGSVIRDEVTPDERAMFDRFLSEVNVGPPITARKGVSPP